MAKSAVLELLGSLKLISRKIWMTEKYWNFHTVHTAMWIVSSFTTVECEHFLAKCDTSSEREKFQVTFITKAGSNTTIVYRVYHLKSVKNTDLGSLIGISDCGYSTVWKFSNYPTTLILREIIFGWFQKVKDWSFNIFWGIEIWFLEKFHTWKCQKLSRIQNS